MQGLAFFWTFRTIKLVLFWIYLWQLKSYHVGRFVDHFRTHKGKTLICNKLLLIKIVLLVLLFVRSELFGILVFLYFAESLLFIKAIANKNIKKPEFTFKAILLTLVSLLVSGGYVFIFVASPIALLLFDILLPIIISIVVLLIQPFFVLARNRILQKATQKIGQHKNLIVIGITGSYGKTSTKEFLTTILSRNLMC